MSNADGFIRLRVRIRVPADSEVGKELNKRAQVDWPDVIQAAVLAKDDLRELRADYERLAHSLTELREDHDRQTRGLLGQLAVLNAAVNDLPARLAGAMAVIQSGRIVQQRSAESMDPSAANVVAAPVHNHHSPLVEPPAAELSTPVAQPRPEIQAAANSLLGQLRRPAKKN